jgi:general secretion pathway protein G
MFESIQRARKSDEGFTLIELLIVIIILGILAAIVVFAVGGINDKGVKSACKSDAKSVEVAQEAEKAQNNAYAASVPQLVADKFLRSAPGTAHYTITSDATGVVTVAKANGTNPLTFDSGAPPATNACDLNAA